MSELDETNKTVAPEDDLSGRNLSGANYNAEGRKQVVQAGGKRHPSHVLEQEIPSEWIAKFSGFEADTSGVCITPENDSALVTLWYDRGAISKIAKLDLSSKMISYPYETDHRISAGIQLSLDCNKALVSSLSPDQIGWLNLRDGTWDWPFSNMKSPLFATLSPNKTTILACEHDGDICYVDLTADKNIVTRPFGAAFIETHPHDIAFYPDASFAMVVCANGTTESKRLAQINLQTNQTRFLSCALQLKNPKAIAINDNFAFILDVGLRRIVVIELSTDTMVILSDIGIGNNGCGITISPCDLFIFICTDRQLLRIPTPTSFVWRLWHNQLSAQEWLQNTTSILVWSLFAENPTFALRAFDQVNEVGVDSIDTIVDFLREGEMASSRVRDTSPDGRLLVDKLVALDPKRIGAILLTAAAKQENADDAATIIRRLRELGAVGDGAVFGELLAKDKHKQSLLERWLLGSPDILNSPEHARSYSSVYMNCPIGTGLCQSMLHSGDSWVPSCFDTSQYVCIDAGSVFKVQGVIVQGRNLDPGKAYGHGFVKFFRFRASIDGISWSDVDDKRPQASRLILKSDATRKIEFDRAVTARYIQLNPILWHSYPPLRCALLVEPPGHQSNHELALCFVRESALLQMSALGCLALPMHSDKALQLMIDYGLVPDQSILKILLRKDKDGSSKWTELVLHLGSTSLVSKLMVACPELAQEALSPSMLALACTPPTAAVAVGLLKKGAVIDERLCEKLLRGGRSSQWSQLANDDQCSELVQILQDHITMVSPGLCDLRHTLKHRNGLVLVFQWQDSMFEFLEPSDFGDVTFNHVEVGSFLHKKTRLLSDIEDDSVEKYDLKFDDATSWNLAEDFLVDGVILGTVEGENRIKIIPKNFSYVGCAPGTRLCVRLPNGSAAQCGEVIELRDDGDYLFRVDNCNTEHRIDPSPSLVKPSAVFSFAPTTMLMLWNDGTWVDASVKSSHARNVHHLALVGSGEIVNVTLNEFNHAEQYMSSKNAYEEARKTYCSSVIKTYEYLEDAITGKKFSVEEQTILINTDSSENAIEKTDQLKPEDIQFIPIPFGTTLEKGSSVRHHKDGRTGVVSGIDLAPTCFDVTFTSDGTAKSCLLEASELKMAAPLPGSNALIGSMSRISIVCVRY